MLDFIKRWYWYDWMMFVIRTILFVSLLFTMEHVSDKLTVPFWLGALWGITAFFIPWMCLQKHYTYYLVSEMVISGGLCLYTVSLFPEAYVAFLGPAFMIASNSAQKSYRWSGPMTIFVFPALFAELSQPSNLMTMIIQFGLIYAVGFAFQLLIVNHRQSEMIRDQYAVLEQYSSQVERMTLAEERNRLSKDLHDAMGHSFTSIMIGLETLRSEVKTPEGERKLDSLLKLTRGSLDEVRQYLLQAGAAQDSLTLVESLQTLTAEFQAMTTGMVHPEPDEGTVATCMLPELGEQQEEPDKRLPPSGLTPREMDILQCLSEGLRYKAIAAKLYLSEGTVRNYASTIYAKLGVRNRDEAVQRVFGN